MIDTDTSFIAMNLITAKDFVQILNEIVYKTEYKVLKRLKILTFVLIS